MLQIGKKRNDLKPIARGWNEMTLGMWQELQDVLKEKDLDMVERNVRLVGFMYDIPDEDAYNLPLDKFADCLDGIGWLSKEPDVPSVSPAYEINGRKYIVSLTPQKITTAQYIDYRSFNGDITANLHLILACFIIPSGHTYNDGYDMVQVQNDIRDHLRYVHSLAISRFFFRQFVLLTNNSLSSLTRMLRKRLRKEKDLRKKEMIREQIQRAGQLEHMIGSLV